MEILLAYLVMAAIVFVASAAILAVTKVPQSGRDIAGLALYSLFWPISWLWLEGRKEVS